MKIIQLQSLVGLFIVIPLFVLLLFASTVQAQTTPRNGSQLGAQNDQLMDGSDDGMQRGAGTGVQDSIPAGDQIQGRLQDPATHEGAGDPVQDRDRIQDQTNIPEGVEPVQARAEQHLRLQTAGELEQYVQEQNRVRAQTEDGTGEQTQPRTKVRVAADAIVAAEAMLGQSGQRMSTMAQEMNHAMETTAAHEEALQERSRVQLFFFGQDEDTVGAMKKEVDQNRDRIVEMKQLMRNCEDCDEGATQFLVEQIQNMEREQTRLQEVTDNAVGQRGVFGFLFGWLR